MLPQRAPAMPGRPATGAILLLILTVTDRASFLTFALSASSSAPWLTAVGAAVGSIAATTLALAEPAVARVLPAIGRVGGGLLLIAGTLTALRLT
jgi:putative Ca2+/H+ antiporter (TMEM165/GDT1 family)